MTKDISTSYVERANLSYAFSQKLENHMHTVGLHFMRYDFCRIHEPLRVTPAMEAGIVEHVWELDEVVQMTEING